MHIARFSSSFLTWGICLLSSVQAASTSWPYQTFQTEPFEQPVLAINKTGAELAEGFFMLTPEGFQGNSAAIMAGNGDLIWNGPNITAGNLMVQSLNGKPVLTFFQGAAGPQGLGSFTYGNISILDDTYTEIYNVCLDLNLVTPDGSSSGCSINAHESLITSRGTILLTIVNITTADLTSIGGPEVGWVNDDIFVEVDITTMEILYKWRALDHIPINATNVALKGTQGLSKATPFDWFHMNSIALLGDGYLISSRMTFSLYAINPTGSLDWTLDGLTGGDFSVPSGANFSWQHHARVYEATPCGVTLSLFNDFNGVSPEYPSNGLLLHLDLETRNVTLLRAYEDPRNQTYSTSQGSFSLLENKNWFVAYGDVPVMKEFGWDGDVRMVAQFGDLPPQDTSEPISTTTIQEMSYRGYKQVWAATPAGYGPAVVVVAEEGKGYVSWNGDTRTTQWIIYAADNLSASSLSESAIVNRTGFETSFEIPAGATLIQVAAVVDNTVVRKTSVISITE